MYLSAFALGVLLGFGYVCQRSRVSESFKTVVFMLNTILSAVFVYMYDISDWVDMVVSLSLAAFSCFAVSRFFSGGGA